MLEIVYSNNYVASFYIAADIVCLLLFGIILYKNVTGIDRQMKSRSFDKVLIVHMAYYLTDAIWALFYFGVISDSSGLGLSICNSFIFAGAALAGCAWLIYTEMLQNVEFVKERRNRIFVMSLASVAILVNFILTFTGHNYIINPNGKVEKEYLYMIFMLVPVIYVGVAFVRGLIKAFKKENKAFKREYLFISSYPLAILAFGLAQIALMNSGLTIPVLCYGTTVAMIFVYVSSLDNLISLDPLTELNNRNELNKHLIESFKSIQYEDNLFVIMIDINKFKSINDKFGHLEGDKALMRVSKCLKNACISKDNDIFLARYGGDEFIIVAKFIKAGDINLLYQNIIEEIRENAQPENNEYELTVSVGISRYSDQDTVEAIIERADKVLYENKNGTRK